jgi:hypothetical protein
MVKPVLVIESDPNDDFLTGSCSICPRVRFKLSGNDLKHKELLRALFDVHLRREHSVDKSRGEDERAA